MKARSIKTTAKMAAVLAAAITTMTPLAAAAQERNDDSGAPPVQTFLVVVDGKRELIESNVPWRLIEDPGGEVRLNVGPGVRGKEYAGRILDGWDGPGATPGERTAAGTWSCYPIAHSPVISGGQLRGYIGAECVGNMPTWRMQWQFERDGFSLTGWAQYAPRKYTNWTTANAQTTTVYAQCSSSQNVTRAYTTYHRGEAVGGYVWGWHRSPGSDRLNCGNNAPA